MRKHNQYHDNYLYKCEQTARAVEFCMQLELSINIRFEMAYLNSDTPSI